MAVLERLVEPLVGLADITSCTKADVVVGIREGQGGQEWLNEKEAEEWSAELNLMPMQKVAGTTLRVWERMSRTNLARFSAEPP